MLDSSVTTLWGVEVSQLLKTVRMKGCRGGEPLHQHNNTNILWGGTQRSDSIYSFPHCSAGLTIVHLCLFQCFSIPVSRPAVQLLQTACEINKVSFGHHYCGQWNYISAHESASWNRNGSYNRQATENWWRAVPTAVLNSAKAFSANMLTYIDWVQHFHCCLTPILLVDHPVHFAIGSFPNGLHYIPVTWWIAQALHANHVGFVWI